ncbi:MAG: folate family ECF transporter S component [Ruminococcaceae bacterium]|nr:folate family ECF transporter S component [Oscillospiraceae bacterium]
MQKQKKNITKRLVLDAVLIALYVLLGYFKIPIGNILRVNMASFAVVICAVAFGPVDGLIVGFMGEFLSQILGPYGLTPTTALWALPEGARGLLLGCAMILLRKKDRTMFLFLLSCILSGIVASLLNTFALYVDSKMYGYYTDYMVFGVLLIRLGIAIVMSGMFGYIARIIVSALRRNKLI